MHASFWFMAIYLPVVGAIIGWVCKWVAIKMMWHPEKWVGIGPIGWQGVVQRRAPKFSAGVADTVARTGITVDALMSRVTSEEIADLVGPKLDEVAPTLVKDVADSVKPGLWESLDDSVRQMILVTLQSESRRITIALADKLRPVLGEVLDVRALIISRLSGPNANRLARLFQTVGKRELEWVIYYGAILGFIIGALSVGGYAFLEKWWVLPIAGAIDGLVNNYLAIEMIFRPLEKKRYLGIFPYQGLFPARQTEISAAYAEMMTKEVLSPEQILEHLKMHGGDKLMKAAIEALEKEVEQQVRMLAMMTGVEVTKEVHDRALAAFVGHLTEQAEKVRPELEAHLTAKLRIRETIDAELAKMPKHEFEEVLRGVFKEDEKTLIIIGGFLGGIIGTIQAGILLVM